MIGLIINHLGREYKIGSKDKFDTYLLISLISHREEFILEGGIGKIASFQKIRDGLKVEVEIDDFKECELSPSITEESNTSEIGVEYYRMTVIKVHYLIEFVQTCLTYCRGTGEWQ